MAKKSITLPPISLQSNKSLANKSAEIKPVSPAKASGQTAAPTPKVTSKAGKASAAKAVGAKSAGTKQPKGSAQTASIAPKTAEKPAAPAQTITSHTVPSKGVAASGLSPLRLMDTLAQRRQDHFNGTMAHVQALHQHWLQAAGRHANTALQFINSVPKSGTWTDMIDWQSRWLLSHAHVHQDGVKALSALASKNMEQIQHSLRIN